MPGFFKTETKRTENRHILYQTWIVHWTKQAFSEGLTKLESKEVTELPKPSKSHALEVVKLVCDLRQREKI